MTMEGEMSVEDAAEPADVTAVLAQLAGAWRVKAAGQSHSHTGQSFAAAIDVCADELLEAVGHMRPVVARLRRVADAAARVASVGYACCCPRETPCERCTDRRELRAALDALTAR